MSVPIERQLFNSANAYYQGATILMKPPDIIGAHSSLIVQPAVTCAALSLKLFLKCLLAIEGKDRDDSSYRIADLYRELSDGAKKMLLGKFDELSNTNMKEGELLQHLEGLDKAFAKWRYIHEKDARSVNLEDLEEMILAAKAMIAGLRPDWA